MQGMLLCGHALLRPARHPRFRIGPGRQHLPTTPVFDTKRSIRNQGVCEGVLKWL